eukprot:3768065-Amphidinium_carterae.3
MGLSLKVTVQKKQSLNNFKTVAVTYFMRAQTFRTKGQGEDLFDTTCGQTTHLVLSESEVP